jgi:hypothetical protein
MWLAPAQNLVSGVGVDFGGITSPRPALRLASHSVGLASHFAGLASTKEPKVACIHCIGFYVIDTLL